MNLAGILGSLAILLILHVQPAGRVAPQGFATAVERSAHVREVYMFVMTRKC